MSICHAMPFAACNLEKEFSLLVDIVVKKNKLKCGLAFSVLLSTTIHVITVVKICGLTQLPLVSPQHFDHCDDAYSLSIRVQAKLNHIRFVNCHIQLQSNHSIKVTLGTEKSGC